MSKSTRKKPTRRSKSRTTEVVVSPASLPPGGGESGTGVSDPPTDAIAAPPAKSKKPYWQAEVGSRQHKQAVKILALRATGMTDKDIADTMGLSQQTIWNYCYMAGKNGWATDFQNAKDQIEFGIMPKVVRELEAGLEDNHRNEKTGLSVRTAVALKIAEGTVFKRFEQTANDRPISNVIAIRIEQVAGEAKEIAEGDLGGVPAYQEFVEGDTVDVGERDSAN